VDRLPIAAPLRTLPRRAAERLALAGGEDYELLFTVPARRAARLERLVLGCRATWIGEIVAGRGVRLVDAAGRRVAAPLRGRGTRPLGYEHFRR
jgi:thiamine-monophosphate kinase